MRIHPAALLACFSVFGLAADGCIVAPPSPSTDPSDPGPSAGPSTIGDGSTSSSSGSTSGGSSSSSGSSTSGDGGDASVDGETEAGDPDESDDASATDAGMPDTSGDGGASDGDASTDDGSTGAGAVDGGSTDAGVDAGLTGVTCTYSVIHNHTPSCDTQCAIKNTLPPEESVVRENVPISIQSSLGGCNGGAAAAWLANKMVKIDAPDLFLKIQLSTTFALRDDSPDAHLYFNDTGVTCSPLVNTSGRISMTVFDSDKISVDMQVNHAPPVGQYCPGVIRGCLIQRVECKGKTTMTVLP